MASESGNTTVRKPASADARSMVLERLESLPGIRPPRPGSRKLGSKKPVKIRGGSVADMIIQSRR